MASTSHTKFPSRFGKYILLDRINSGGMAEVYRAKVTGVEQFQRLLAIKCMLPALHEDEQFVTMFKDEAKLSAQLSHANIVQIYELGQIEQQLYIAMELINGRDLRSVLRVSKAKGIPIPPSFAAYVVAKAAEGLDFAHHKTGMQGEPLNLVHRDVSPQNILVSYEGEVKVVDFGIAKAEERATETRSGVLKGKFAYMAPEQVMGTPLDARADIFALGCVLYEVLVGKKLFTGESDLSILDKVRNAAVPDFRVQIPDAPDELYDVLRTSLAKDPNDRFPRANDMAEALEPVLIEDRKIFGAKRARELMHLLYAEEIAELAERTKRWTALTDADCEDGPDLSSQTQIFESAFAGGLTGHTIQLDEPTSAGAPTSGPKGTVPIPVPPQGLRKGDGPDGAEPARPRMPTGDGALASASSAPVSRPRMPTGDGALAPAEAARPRMPTGDGDLVPFADPDGRTATAISAGDSFFEDGGTAVSEGPAMESLPPTQLGAEMAPLPPTQLGEEISVSDPGAEPPPLTVPRGIVIASVAGAVLMLALVVAVALIPVGGSGGPDAPQAPAVTEVIELTEGGDGGGLGAPVSGTTIVEISPSGAPVPKAPASPAQDDPVPEPSTDSLLEEDLLAEDGSDGQDADDDEGGGDSAEEARKGKGKRKFGYVSVRATGAKSARILVGNREVGKSPLPFLKLRVGKHRIRVVEETPSGDGRSRTVSVTVLPKNTRKQPVRLVVPLL